MAIPANTTETFDRVGIKEDLQEIITNISVTDTPFQANIGQGTSKGTFHEWQTDELETAAHTPAVEGADAVAAVRTPTVRVGNYTQTNEKTVSVSGSNEESDNAGRGEEMAYQMAKASKEIKRDIELSLIGDNHGRAAGSSGTARVSGSLHSFIATNVNSAGDATESAGDGTIARTDGTARTFTEALLTDVIDQTYLSGGDADIIMANTVQKRVLTGFTGNATKYKEVDDKKIINAVDVYVSDFGELMIVPNRSMRQNEVFLIDKDMFSVDYYRPFKITDLAKTGDSVKKQLIAEWTLMSKQEKSSGAIYDLS